MSVSCAVLLDRDGTLIEDKHYLSEPSGVALLPGVGPALSRLVQAGHRLFLVSNQSGVGRGYFTEQAVVACQKRLEELLEPYGVAFTDAVWCPHAPEESCFCRKPLPGMFGELRARHGLLPETTFMIGDKLDDLGSPPMPAVRRAARIERERRGTCPEGRISRARFRYRRGSGRAPACRCCGF